MDCVVVTIPAAEPPSSIELENLKPDADVTDSGVAAAAVEEPADQTSSVGESAQTETRRTAERRFPQRFVWGVATSAYQIEGATGPETGRGSSIWDDFCRRPGAISDASSGSVACDHYHLWNQDLDLIRSLGVSAYRFSVAWPRVIPNGRGAVNSKGLDFYDSLIDGLLQHGIEPFLTLYHWDLPSALQDEGGWQNRATAEAFGEYASVVAQRLGDRVKFWTTYNELPCVIYLGHKDGNHAPGLKLPEKEVLQLTHELLVGHGLAALAIRAAVPGAKVGLVHNPGIPQPLTESAGDIAAAREAFHNMNGWLLQPVFGGTYPSELWESYGDNVPNVRSGDLHTIGQPLDFFGLNAYHSSFMVSADGTKTEFQPDHPRTDMEWPVTPDCLYWGCRFIDELYAPAEIYITENGCAYPDELCHVDGKACVSDPNRISYLEGYLTGVQRAISEGMPVRGYFVWSLMDNFEWAHGYTKRFGLVHVDYATQTRTPKASALWYSHVIKENRI